MSPSRESVSTRGYPQSRPPRLRRRGRIPFQASVAQATPPPALHGPVRLARDRPQIPLPYRVAPLGHRRQVQEVLDDVRRQQREVHQLRQPRPRDPPQPRQFRVVPHLAIAESTRTGIESGRNLWTTIRMLLEKKYSRKLPKCSNGGESSMRLRCRMEERPVKLIIDDDFRQICKEIISRYDDDGPDSLIWSDDEYQRGVFCGGWNPEHRKFFFSYYAPDGGDYISRSP